MKEKSNKDEKKEELLKELENCREERDAYLEGLKRSKADLINYKKGEYSRLDSHIVREKENTILKIIKILDNFDLAAKEVKGKETEDSLILGFLRIKEQLENFLKEEDIKTIKTIGEDFDPEYHEAVEMTDSPSNKSGEIVEELQKGYILKDKVIRPSKVKVVK